MFTSTVLPPSESSPRPANAAPAKAPAGASGSSREPFPEGAPLAVLATEAVISSLERVEAQIRAAEAERFRLLAAAFDIAACSSDTEKSIPVDRAGELALRAIRAEVALTLGISEYTANRMLSLAYELHMRYQDTFEALEDGELTSTHAQIIVDAGGLILEGSPQELHRRASYEHSVLPIAKRVTANRLRPIAQRLAEQAADRSLDERHTEASAKRHVRVEDRDDGMADLIAYLPAHHAYAIRQRLTELTDEPDTPSDTRTRDQARADALTDLLLDSRLDTGSEAERSPLPISVFIPVDRLGVLPSSDTSADGFDSTDIALPQPATLSGYGPIATDVARELAALASTWTLIYTDPENGDVLRTNRYRPSAAIRRFLTARDQHCRFPGCRVAAQRCDIDHTVPASRGGPTSVTNLAHLCRGHHILKHHTGWRYTLDSRGIVTWTSPAGRVHTDRPPGEIRYEDVPF